MAPKRLRMNILLSVVAKHVAAVLASKTIATAATLAATATVTASPAQPLMVAATAVRIVGPTSIMIVSTLKKLVTGKEERPEAVAMEPAAVADESALAVIMMVAVRVAFAIIASSVFSRFMPKNSIYKFMMRGLRRAVASCSSGTKEDRAAIRIQTLVRRVSSERVLLRMLLDELQRIEAESPKESLRDIIDDIKSSSAVPQEDFPKLPSPAASEGKRAGVVINGSSSSSISISSSGAPEITAPSPCTTIGGREEAELDGDTEDGSLHSLDHNENDDVRSTNQA